MVSKYVIILLTLKGADTAHESYTNSQYQYHKDKKHQYMTMTLITVQHEEWRRLVTQVGRVQSMRPR